MAVDIAFALRDIESSIESFGGMSGGPPGPFATYGQSLFFLLFVIAVSWHGIRVLLEGGILTDILGGLMRTVFTAGFVYWLITDRTLFDAVSETFTVLAQTGMAAASGGSIAASSGISGGAADALKLLLKTNGHIADGILALLTNGKSVGITDVFSIIGRFLYYLVPIIALIVSLGMVLFAAGTFFVFWGVSTILIALSLVVAPIMIPWILIGPLSFLFDSWLKFFITAGMYKVVGGIMVGLGSVVISKGIDLFMKDITASASIADWAAINVAAFVMAGAAILLAYMMLSIGSLAGALVGGGARVGIGGLKGMASQAGSMGVSMGRGVVGAGVSAAGKTASGIGSAVSAVNKSGGVGNAAKSLGGAAYSKVSGVANSIKSSASNSVKAHGGGAGGVAASSMKGAGNAIDKLGGMIRG